MIAPRRVLRSDDPELVAGFDAIRAEFAVPARFPPEVLAAAEAAVASFSLTGAETPAREDRRDLPFITIDPAGSRDLDQAYHAARLPHGGFALHYAIADVSAFVTMGDPVDAEARRRGGTTYLPDARAPLYPEIIGEGAASLLPDGDRPALLWTFELDAAGQPRTTRFARAVVRSRAARSYADVQSEIDGGHAAEPVALLAEIGALRIEAEIARGGVSIELNEQEVVRTGDTLELVDSGSLPVERWNAQLSLLTGMAAAAIMVRRGVGLLRTMPPPPQFAIDALRHAARALHIPWPKGAAYTDVIRSVDADTERGTAFLLQAVHTLRGAAYEVVDPANTVATQAAVAAPYAHVTAPLRRYADRFVNEIALAAAADADPPTWARVALPDLPSVMDAAARRDRAVDHAVVDLLEAILLERRVGETFPATVVDVHKDGSAVVQIEDPPVQATLAAGHALGAELTLRLDTADRTTRTVAFSVVDGGR